jgi:hypothetical protein
MLTKRLLLRIGAAPLLLLAALSAQAIAQQSQSVGLSPAYLDADVKPGSVYTQEFAVSNRTSARLRFRASLGDLGYDAENRRVEARPGTTPRSASPWVRFVPDELTVEPGGSAKFKAVITVPDSARGGYYTVPYFQGEPVEEQSTPGRLSQGVAVRLGGLLLLATSSGSEYRVLVKGGAVVPPSSSSPLSLALDLKNEGNAHAVLKGTFAFLDGSSRVAGRGQISEQRLLPGQRAQAESEWAGELPPGDYTAVVTLTYARAGSQPATLVYEIPFAVK